MKHKTVELIAIGDELLSGLRANGHLLFLGGQLAEHGLQLQHGSEVMDDADAIAGALALALGRSQVVILTGGLGPTADDLTAAAVAECLGRRLVRDAATAEAIRSFFDKRGRQPTANNFKQAEVIEGAVVLANAHGTAPGQLIEHGDGQLVFLLPGPPRELIPLFEGAVLPHLVRHGLAVRGQGSLNLRTLGVGESVLAQRIEPHLDPLRERLRVAYCATDGYVDVRLTRKPGKMTEAELRAVGEQLREWIGDDFLDYGYPDAACHVIKRLRGLSKTLAVAESCTGGLLGSRFTDVAGASKSFRGGVICYNNAVKQDMLGVPVAILEQHGAVSAECAVAMATAVAELMEADYALAVTGFAGPEGGNEPAGTVYIGYHSPIGVWSRRVVLPGTRVQVKERAALAAIDFMRRKLNKYQMYELLDALRC